MSDNDKCHFADTTAEWRYGKQRLKRCVFRRLRKTARDGADVTWCGKPFQTRQRRPGKLDRRWLTAAYGGQSAMVTTSSVTVRGLAEFIGKVRRCCSVLTLVNKESKLDIDSLRRHQPAQLTEKWSDMVVPRRAEH